jgi:hypothetical protein
MFAEKKNYISSAFYYTAKQIVTITRRSQSYCHFLNSCHSTLSIA